MVPSLSQLKSCLMYRKPAMQSAAQMAVRANGQCSKSKHSKKHSYRTAGQAAGAGQRILEGM
eukprot:882442-Pelagomonas_calceolata.AAC.1